MVRKFSNRAVVLEGATGALRVSVVVVEVAQAISEASQF